ncbi:MAG: cupin domain-containing protein [Marinoscillum sp.]|uniref:cupin domain-containing protein n=1 Tax=Marinoscillum sp. TaxID=2024838 RepID=UPI0032F66567
MPRKIFAYLEDMKGESTAHLSGFKKVFLTYEDTGSAMTQFAYGIFKPGERCENHVHPTMMECFYFISGFGMYKVGGELVRIKPGTFLRIPPNIPHDLRNDGTENLEFVYFGIATNNYTSKLD